MRRISSIAGIAALAVLVTPLLSCGDAAGPGPTAPPLAAVAAAGATQEKGVGLFESSGTGFNECLGEVTSARIAIPYTYHATTTPSGNTIFVDHFIPGAANGTLVGLTTGRVWTMRRNISPEVIRTTAGEMYHAVANIWWESETGPDVQYHNSYHIVQNASGDITVERLVIRCTLH